MCAVLKLTSWLAAAGLVMACALPTALAKPRAVTEAPLQLRLPAAPAIDMACPTQPALQAAPQAAHPLRVESSSPGPDLALDHPVRADHSPELVRLRAQASATTPSRDSSQAAWQLGLIHLHGAGVPSDRVQAQLWFEQAAQYLNWAPLAPAGLAWCQMSGCLAAPDPDKAELALHALHAGAPARASYLGWLLAQQTAQVAVALPGGSGPGSPIKTGTTASALPATARDELLQAAARQGDAQARVELGIRAATANRLDEASRWFQSVASQSRAARINLERLHLWRQAAHTPTLPVRHGAGAAAFDKAQRLHRGLGGPPNYAQAIELYRQAAQQGHAPAKAMLALIFSRPGPGGELNVAWMQQVAQVNVHTALPQVTPEPSLHLVRDPTPLFDLMAPFWQRQVPATGM